MRVTQKGKIYKLQHLLITMKSKKVMILFCCLFLSVLLIGSVSAWNFDDVLIEGNINPNTGYPNLEIKNCALWAGTCLVQGETLFEGKLQEHTETCGIDCYSKMEITHSGGILIDDIEFRTIKDDGSYVVQPIRSYNFEYEAELPEYETTCEMIDGNESCTTIQTGTYAGFLNYNIGEELTEGNYELYLRGEKKPTRTVDWVIQIKGRWLNSWAYWGGYDFTDYEYLLTEDNLTISSGTTILGGNKLYNQVYIDVDAILEINSTIGYLNITAYNVTIFGNVTGTGKSNNTGGASGGSGGALGSSTDAGNGGNGDNSGSTGGFGGTGGRFQDGTFNAGGNGGASASVIGTETGINEETISGLGGGAGGGGGGSSGTSGAQNGDTGSSGTNSRGGATIKINSGLLYINGKISMNGATGGDGGDGKSASAQDSSSGGGGGGAGGSGGQIILQGVNVNISNSILNTAGGSGGSGGSGGGSATYGDGGSGSSGATGSGGRIKVFYGTLDNSSMTGTSSTTYFNQISSVGVITLNSPEDNFISQLNEIEFNTTVNITGGATIANISLWHNSSGVFQEEQAYSFLNEIYDLTDDSSINTSLWRVESTGSATTGEDTNSLFTSINIDQDSINWYSKVESISIPTDLNNIMKIVINAKVLQSVQAGRSGTSTAKLTVFGNDIIIVSGGESSSSSDISEWLIVRNGNDFDIYDDNIFNLTITPTDTNISIYSNVNLAGGSGFAVSKSDIYNMTYETGTSVTTIITSSITGNTLWGIQACDSDGDCGFSENRTVLVDIIPPNITLTSPLGIIESIAIGNNLSVNWTVSDTNLDSCWFDYNNINTTVNCAANNYSFTTIDGQQSLIFYANDTVGNLGSNTTSWTYIIAEINQTFNNPAIELSFENFELFVNASEVITQTLLNYNGTNYVSNLLSLGGGIYHITSTIQIPAFDSNVNVSFFYNITTTSTSDILLPVRLQEVRVLNVGNCTDFDNLIMNLSLFDERTLEDITGTIEFDLEILNEIDNSLLNKLSTIFTDIHNTEVCTDINLSAGNYIYALELRYYSGNDTTNVFSYVPEFYHIQQGDVANLPQTINLYSLNVNESTEFTIFYRDNDYIARENVLFQIQRKYVDEGIFRVIEIPITSSEGSAVGHFDLNNYKYRITVTENGEVLNVFDNPSIRCESELSGICEIRLKGLASVPSTEFTSDLVDFFYTVDQTNDSVIVDFSIPSGESLTVNIVMIQSSAFADDTIICNQSIVTSAGQVECDISSSIGDSSVSIKITSAGTVQGLLKATFQEDLNSNFLLNNYFIGAVMLMTLILMFISSPPLMIGASVFGVIFLGLIFILKSSSIGLFLGAISWLIVSAIIILTKLNKKAEQ